MKPLLLRALPAFWSFLLLGATCVTHVEQKGPEGPWVGEVTNTGPELVQNLTVSGDLMGANGRYLMREWARVCPSELPQGQKSFFMFPAVPPTILAGRPDVTLPLSIASINVTTSTGFPIVTGVSFKVAAIDKERNAILVEMHNDSSNTYYPQHVCAIRREFGKVQEITGTEAPRLFHSILPPYGTITFPIQFSAVDGAFDFSLRAGHGPWIGTSLAPRLFYAGASKVVQTDRGRELRVVGEVLNDSGFDLASAALEAYLESSPVVRTVAAIGSNGTVPAGQKTPVTFALPLGDDDSTEFGITGIEANRSPEKLSRVLVRDVAWERVGADSVKVRATLVNPTDEKLAVHSVCFQLRGSGRRLVGASCSFPPWIEPHGTVTMFQEVTELAATRSVEVDAYGLPGGIPVIPPPTS